MKENQRLNPDYVDPELEQAYEKPNKRRGLRVDQYAIAFMGYIYIEQSQRPNIRIKSKYIQHKNSRLEKEVTEGEVSRNLMYCVIIFLIQMILVTYLLNTFIDEEKKAT